MPIFKPRSVTHHHYYHDSKVEGLLRTVARKLDLIHMNQETIMIDTSALVAAAQRAKKDSADVLAVLTSVRNNNAALAVRLEEVKAQLEAIPADTAAAEAAIASVVADLNQIAQDSEDAVADNAAVPNMPEQPTQG